MEDNKVDVVVKKDSEPKKVACLTLFIISIVVSACSLGLMVLNQLLVLLMGLSIEQLNLGLGSLIIVLPFGFVMATLDFVKVAGFIAGIILWIITIFLQKGKKMSTIIIFVIFLSLIVLCHINSLRVLFGYPSDPNPINEFLYHIITGKYLS